MTAVRYISRSGILPAAAVLLACACAGPGPASAENGGPGGGGGGAPVLTATVNMLSSSAYGEASNSFSPVTVGLAAGGTVTWVNQSGFVHNVTFTTPGAPANVPDIGSGEASRTFPSSGSFAYECTNHPGMSGLVTVAP
jgi:plastocyanin